MMYVQCKCVKKSLFSICDFLERNIVSMSSSLNMFFFILYDSSQIDLAQPMPSLLYLCYK